MTLLLIFSLSELFDRAQKAKLSLRRLVGLSAGDAAASASAAGEAQTPSEQVAGQTRSSSAPSLPQAFALGAPYPNPTSGGAAFPLSLPEASDVQAEVYDVLGRRVATLADRAFAAGRRTLRFRGQGLASGLYFVRVTVEPASGEGRVFTEKVTLVK